MQIKDVSVTAVIILMFPAIFSVKNIKKRMKKKIKIMYTEAIQAINPTN